MTDIPCYGRRTLFAALLLAAVTLAVDWPVRHFDFVVYDDNDYVYENSNVTDGLTRAGVAWAFVDQHAGNWHPLTWLSHMADCQFFGVNPEPAHLENALFHCANTILLLLLLQSLTGAFWRSAVVAALFALHPLRVESVAWISERKDVLSGFFFMLTLLGYVRYVNESKVQGPKSKVLYGCALLMFALALLSKPMVITLPVILLLLDFWPLQRFNDSTTQRTPPLQRFNASTLQRLSIEKAPFFLLATAIGIITLFAQHAGGAWHPSATGILQCCEQVIVNYAAYVEKLLWPHDLSFLYLRPEKVPLAQVALSALLLLAISVAVAARFRSRPWLAIGWLWFVVMLLPVCGLFPLGKLSIADRYTYLPSIGFYLLLVWMIADILTRFPAPRLCRSLGIAGAAAILVLCIALTRQQLGYWQNTETLMNHALEIDPHNDVAKQNLHLYLLEKAHPELKNKP